MRRRGTTLVELMFAAAVLAAALIAVYSALHHGFRTGSYLETRERADAIAHALVERYGVLPADQVIGAFPDGEPLDPPAHPLDPPDSDQFERRVHLRLLPGELPAAAVKVVVAWTDITGRRRQVVHRRYRVLGLASLVSEGKLSDRGGFSKTAEAVGWGRAEAWDPEAKVPEGSPSPSTGAALFLAPTAGTKKTIDSPALAARALRDAAVSARFDPKGDYNRPEGQALRFRAAPGVAEKLMGPGGLFARSHRRARGVADPRAQRARGLTRFLARAGLSSTDPTHEEIPDGVYPARLEAFDLRAADGEGKVLGVFVLGVGDPTYRLVGTTRTAPTTGRTLGGEDVLQAWAVEDPDGLPSLAARTESRLVLVSLQPDLPRRTLELRTLPVYDGSSQGTRATNEWVDEALRARRLARREIDAPTPLLDAAAGTGLTTKGGLVYSNSRAADLEVEGGLPVHRVEPMASGCTDCEAPATRRSPLPGTAASSSAPAPGAADAAPSDAVTRAVELAQQDPVAALGLLDERLRDAPRDVEARRLRAGLRAVDDNPSGAVDDLSFLLREEGESAPVLRDLAGYLMRAGRPDEAEVYLDRLEALAPGDEALPSLRQSLPLTRQWVAAGMPKIGQRLGGSTRTVDASQGSPTRMGAGGVGVGWR